MSGVTRGPHNSVGANLSRSGQLLFGELFAALLLGVLLSPSFSETLSPETWAVLPAKVAASWMSCTTWASFVGGRVDLMLLHSQGVVLLIASRFHLHNPDRNRSWKCDWKWLKGSNDQASSGTVKPLLTSNISSSMPKSQVIMHWSWQWPLPDLSSDHSFTSYPGFQVWSFQASSWKTAVWRELLMIPICHGLFRSQTLGQSLQVWPIWAAFVFIKVYMCEYEYNISKDLLADLPDSGPSKMFTFNHHAHHYWWYLPV